MRISLHFFIKKWEIVWYDETWNLWRGDLRRAWSVYLYLCSPVSARSHHLRLGQQSILQPQAKNSTSMNIPMIPTTHTQACDGVTASLLQQPRGPQHCCSSSGARAIAARGIANYSSVIINGGTLLMVAAVDLRLSLLQGLILILILIIYYYEGP